MLRGAYNVLRALGRCASWPVSLEEAHGRVPHCREARDCLGFTSQADIVSPGRTGSPEQGAARFSSGPQTC